MRLAFFSEFNTEPTEFMELHRVVVDVLSVILHNSVSLC
jgi:hypothetical protein